MAATFVNIAASEFSAFMLAQGFSKVDTPGIFEDVYGKRVDVDGIALTLRVYSGINSDGGFSRSVGSDAIRVALLYRADDGTIRGVGKGRRVHRVANWRSNLASRIADITPTNASLSPTGWLTVFNRSQVA